MPEHASPPAPNPYAWLWAEIARRFGDADHTTVLYHLRVVARRRARSARYADALGVALACSLRVEVCI